MRLNALKTYDVSNGHQTSSKCNSLVTTILSKIKWKNISAGNNISEEGVGRRLEEQKI